MIAGREVAESALEAGKVGTPLLDGGGFSASCRWNEASRDVPKYDVWANYSGQQSVFPADFDTAGPVQLEELADKVSPLPPP